MILAFDFKDHLLIVRFKELERRSTGLFLLPSALFWAALRCWSPLDT
jgi:hypothetical protein